MVDFPKAREGGAFTEATEARRNALENVADLEKAFYSQYGQYDPQTKKWTSGKKTANDFAFKEDEYKDLDLGLSLRDMGNMLVDNVFLDPWFSLTAPRTYDAGLDVIRRDKLVRYASDFMAKMNETGQKSEDDDKKFEKLYNNFIDAYKSLDETNKKFYKDLSEALTNIYLGKELSHYPIEEQIQKPIKYKNIIDSEKRKLKNDYDYNDSLDDLDNYRKSVCIDHYTNKEKTKKEHLKDSGIY